MTGIHVYKILNSEKWQASKQRVISLDFRDDKCPPSRSAFETRNALFAEIRSSMHDRVNRNKLSRLDLRGGPALYLN